MNGIVDVYKNTTKKVWSVKQCGLVIGHTDSLILENVRFKCSEKTIARIRNTNRKTPCAYVHGNILCSAPFDDDLKNALSNAKSLKKVVFNPFYFTSFVFEKTRRPILCANYCVMIYPEVFILHAIKP